jgi:hypothetical protein
MLLAGSNVIDFPVSKVCFLLLHDADDIRDLPFIQPDQNYSFLLGMESEPKRVRFHVRKIYVLKLTKWL